MDPPLASQRGEGAAQHARHVGSASVIHDESGMLRDHLLSQVVDACQLGGDHGNRFVLIVTETSSHCEWIVFCEHLLISEQLRVLWTHALPGTSSRVATLDESVLVVSTDGVQFILHMDEDTGAFPFCGLAYPAHIPLSATHIERLLAALSDPLSPEMRLTKWILVQKTRPVESPTPQTDSEACASKTDAEERNDKNTQEAVRVQTPIGVFSVPLGLTETIATLRATFSKAHGLPLEAVRAWSIDSTRTCELQLEDETLIGDLDVKLTTRQVQEGEDGPERLQEHQRDKGKLNVDTGKAENKEKTPKDTFTKNPRSEEEVFAKIFLDVDVPTPHLDEMRTELEQLRQIVQSNSLPSPAGWKQAPLSFNGLITHGGKAELAACFAATDLLNAPALVSVAIIAEYVRVRAALCHPGAEKCNNAEPLPAPAPNMGIILPNDKDILLRNEIFREVSLWESADRTTKRPHSIRRPNAARHGNFLETRTQETPGGSSVTRGYYRSTKNGNSRSSKDEQTQVIRNMQECFSSAMFGSSLLPQHDSCTQSTTPPPKRSLFSCIKSVVPSCLARNAACAASAHCEWSEELQQRPQPRAPCAFLRTFAPSSQSFGSAYLHVDNNGRCELRANIIGLACVADGLLDVPGEVVDIGFTTLTSTQRAGFRFFRRISSYDLNAAPSVRASLLPLPWQQMEQDVTCESLRLAHERFLDSALVSDAFRIKSAVAGECGMVAEIVSSTIVYAVSLTKRACVLSAFTFQWESSTESAVALTRAKETSENGRGQTQPVRAMKPLWRKRILSTPDNVLAVHCDVSSPDVTLHALWVLVHAPQANGMALYRYDLCAEKCAPRKSVIVPWPHAEGAKMRIVTSNSLIVILDDSGTSWAFFRESLQHLERFCQQAHDVHSHPGTSPSRSIEKASLTIVPLARENRLSFIVRSDTHYTLEPLPARTTPLKVSVPPDLPFDPRSFGRSRGFSFRLEAPSSMISTEVACNNFVSGFFTMDQTKTPSSALSLDFTGVVCLREIHVDLHASLPARLATFYASHHLRSVTFRITLKLRNEQGQLVQACVKELCVAAKLGEDTLVAPHFHRRAQTQLWSKEQLHGPPPKQLVSESTEMAKEEGGPATAEDTESPYNGYWCAKFWNNEVRTVDIYIESAGKGDLGDVSGLCILFRVTPNGWPRTAEHEAQYYDTPPGVDMIDWIDPQRALDGTEAESCQPLFPQEDLFLIKDRADTAERVNLLPRKILVSSCVRSILAGQLWKRQSSEMGAPSKLRSESVLATLEKIHLVNDVSAHSLDMFFDYFVHPSKRYVPESDWHRYVGVLCNLGEELVKVRNEDPNAYHKILCFRFFSKDGGSHELFSRRVYELEDDMPGRSPLSLLWPKNTAVDPFTAQRRVLSSQNVRWRHIFSEPAEYNVEISYTLGNNGAMNLQSITDAEANQVWDSLRRELGLEGQGLLPVPQCDNNTEPREEKSLTTAAASLVFHNPCLKKLSPDPAAYINLRCNLPLRPKGSARSQTLQFAFEATNGTMEEPPLITALTCSFRFFEVHNPRRFGNRAICESRASLYCFSSEELARRACRSNVDTAPGLTTFGRLLCENHNMEGGGEANYLNFHCETPIRTRFLLLVIHVRGPCQVMDVHLKGTSLVSEARSAPATATLQRAQELREKVGRLFQERKRALKSFLEANARRWELVGKPSKGDTRIFSKTAFTLRCLQNLYTAASRNLRAHVDNAAAFASNDPLAEMRLIWRANDGDIDNDEDDPSSVSALAMTRLLLCAVEVFKFTKKAIGTTHLEHEQIMSLLRSFVFFGSSPDLSRGCAKLLSSHLEMQPHLIGDILSSEAKQHPIGDGDWIKFGSASALFNVIPGDGWTETKFAALISVLLAVELFLERALPLHAVTSVLRDILESNIGLFLRSGITRVKSPTKSEKVHYSSFRKITQITLRLFARIHSSQAPSWDSSLWSCREEISRLLNTIVLFGKDEFPLHATFEQNDFFILSDLLFGTALSGLPCCSLIADEDVGKSLLNMVVAKDGYVPETLTKMAYQAPVSRRVMEAITFSRYARFPIPAETLRAIVRYASTFVDDAVCWTLTLSILRQLKTSAVAEIFSLDLRLAIRQHLLVSDTVEDTLQLAFKLREYWLVLSGKVGTSQNPPFADDGNGPCKHESSADVVQAEKYGETVTVETERCETTDNARDAAQGQVMSSMSAHCDDILLDVLQAGERAPPELLFFIVTQLQIHFQRISFANMEVSSPLRLGLVSFFNHSLWRILSTRRDARREAERKAEAATLAAKKTRGCNDLRQAKARILVDTKAMKDSVASSSKDPEAANLPDVLATPQSQNSGGKEAFGEGVAVSPSFLTPPGGSNIVPGLAASSGKKSKDTEASSEFGNESTFSLFEDESSSDCRRTEKRLAEHNVPAVVEEDLVSILFTISQVRDVRDLIRIDNVVRILCECLSLDTPAKKNQEWLYFNELAAPLSIDECMVGDETRKHEAVLVANARHAASANLRVFLMRLGECHPATVAQTCVEALSTQGVNQKEIVADALLYIVKSFPEACAHLINSRAVNTLSYLIASSDMSVKNSVSSAATDAASCAQIETERTSTAHKEVEGFVAETLQTRLGLRVPGLEAQDIWNCHSAPDSIAPAWLKGTLVVPHPRPQILSGSDYRNFVISMNRHLQSDPQRKQSGQGVKVHFPKGLTGFRNFQFVVDLGTTCYLSEIQLDFVDTSTVSPPSPSEVRVYVGATETPLQEVAAQRVTPIHGARLFEFRFSKQSPAVGRYVRLVWPEPNDVNSPSCPNELRNYLIKMLRFVGKRHSEVQAEGSSQTRKRVRLSSSEARLVAEALIEVNASSSCFLSPLQGAQTRQDLLRWTCIHSLPSSFAKLAGLVKFPAAEVRDNVKHVRELISQIVLQLGLLDGRISSDIELPVRVRNALPQRLNALPNASEGARRMSACAWGLRALLRSATMGQVFDVVELALESICLFGEETGTRNALAGVEILEVAAESLFLCTKGESRPSSACEEDRAIRLAFCLTENLQRIWLHPDLVASQDLMSNSPLPGGCFDESRVYGCLVLASFARRIGIAIVQTLTQLAGAFPQIVGAVGEKILALSRADAGDFMSNGTMWPSVHAQYLANEAQNAIVAPSTRPSMELCILLHCAAGRVSESKCLEFAHDAFDAVTTGASDRRRGLRILSLLSENGPLAVRTWIGERVADLAEIASLEKLDEDATGLTARTLGSILRRDPESNPLLSTFSSWIKQKLENCETTHWQGDDSLVEKDDDTRARVISLLMKTVQWMEHAPICAWPGHAVGSTELIQVARLKDSQWATAKDLAEPPSRILRTFCWTRRESASPISEEGPCGELVPRNLHGKWNTSSEVEPMQGNNVYEFDVAPERNEDDKRAVCVGIADMEEPIAWTGTSILWWGVRGTYLWHGADTTNKKFSFEKRVSFRLDLAKGCLLIAADGDWGNAHVFENIPCDRKYIATVSLEPQMSKKGLRGELQGFHPGQRMIKCQAVERLPLRILMLWEWHVSRLEALELASKTHDNDDDGDDDERGEEEGLAAAQQTPRDDPENGWMSDRQIDKEMTALANYRVSAVQKKIQELKDGARSLAREPPRTFIESLQLGHTMRNGRQTLNFPVSAHDNIWRSHSPWSGDANDYAWALRPFPVISLRNNARPTLVRASLALALGDCASLTAPMTQISRWQIMLARLKKFSATSETEKPDFSRRELRFQPCSIAHTGKRYITQTRYACLTCKLSGGLGCCVACAAVCHEGHTLEEITSRFGFYCDCNIETSLCKCLHDSSYALTATASASCGSIQDISVSWQPAANDVVKEDVALLCSTLSSVAGTFKYVLSRDSALLGHLVRALENKLLSDFSTSLWEHAMRRLKPQDTPDSFCENDAVSTIEGFFISDSSADANGTFSKPRRRLRVCMEGKSTPLETRDPFYERGHFFRDGDDWMRWLMFFRVASEAIFPELMGHETVFEIFSSLLRSRFAKSDPGFWAVALCRQDPWNFFVETLPQFTKFDIAHLIEHGMVRLLLLRLGDLSGELTGFSSALEARQAQYDRRYLAIRGIFATPVAESGQNPEATSCNAGSEGAAATLAKPTEFFFGDLVESKSLNPQSDSWRLAIVCRPCQNGSLILNYGNGIFDYEAPLDMVRGLLTACEGSDERDGSATLRTENVVDTTEVKRSMRSRSSRSSSTAGEKVSLWKPGYGSGVNRDTDFDSRAHEETLQKRRAAQTQILCILQKMMESAHGHDGVLFAAEVRNSFFPLVAHEYLFGNTVKSLIDNAELVLILLRMCKNILTRAEFESLRHFEIKGRWSVAKLVQSLADDLLEELEDTICAECEEDGGLLSLAAESTGCEIPEIALLESLVKVLKESRMALTACAAAETCSAETCSSNKDAGNYLPDEVSKPSTSTLASEYEKTLGALIFGSAHYSRDSTSEGSKEVQSQGSKTESYPESLANAAPSAEDAPAKASGATASVKLKSSEEGNSLSSEAKGQAVAQGEESVATPSEEGCTGAGSSSMSHTHESKAGSFALMSKAQASGEEGSDALKESQIVGSEGTSKTKTVKASVSTVRSSWAPHYFADKRDCESGGRTARTRAMRLNREVRSLRKSLPVHWGSSIAVRIDERQPFFMQAIILAPGGTPYDSGCFLFDIYVPPEYPSEPPKVHSMTTGNGLVRFNPNLYSSGKVCLSLLGTWRGGATKNEMWTKKSTLIQVLVSIQSAILGAEFPYFNEPGAEVEWGTARGRRARRLHANGGYEKLRESTIQHAIIAQILDPPRFFEDLVREHFRLKCNHIQTTVQGWVAEAEEFGPSAHLTNLRALQKELKFVLDNLASSKKA